ncbi:TRNA-t(6)A37 methylthiotransferase [Aphelenchoides bicaudatus]|nr:TRNA-t(6)A37 methylthiotransferase [Aphelenchoides bicaudatus]
MPDIEDGFDLDRAPRPQVNNVVHTKFRPKNSGDNEKPMIESDVGWDKIVYAKTWGCAHNGSDTEIMCGLLSQAGYTLTNDSDEANLWLLNSCTVKTPSETQMDNSVAKALSLGKRVVVAGCVSQAAPNNASLKDVSLIGVQQIDQIVYVVEETLKGNTVRLLSQRRKENLSLDMPKVRKNKFIEILAINSGCLNHCTYCKTKQARGDLRSFSLEAIVERAKQSFDEGCKELWLTSEDLGAYGRDIGLVLPDLLNELVKVIPDGCMMRLGMTNPPYILDYLEELAAILRHPKVYSFLHIPVQSASDSVLGEMKREYTSQQFCQLVDFMIANVPGLYLATDFILAFPTETVEDFEESMAMVEKYRFPSLFINQYYPRPNTPASRLKKIDTVEARRRTAEMSKLFRGYSRYTEDRIGKIYDVLVTEKAADKEHYVGHNKSYEQILIPSERDLLGERVKVQITEVSKFHMKSRIVDQNDDDLSENSTMKNKFPIVLAAFVAQIAVVVYLLLKGYLL